VKQTILAVILSAAATLASAGNSNDVEIGDIKPTATSNVTFSSGLGGKTLSPSAEANSTNVNTMIGGSQYQGQTQGQKQNAISTSGVKNSGNSVSVSGGGSAEQSQSMAYNESERPASSAPSFIGAVHGCTAIAGATGQGFGGGGGVGIPVTSYHCAVMLEVALLEGLEGKAVAKDHAARYLSRVGETLRLNGYIAKKDNTKKQWTKDLSASAGRK